MTDYKLVPFEPTPEMVEAAEDAYMPFGDMDIALRMAVLSAPAVQGEPVITLLIDDPEQTANGWELGEWDVEPNAAAIEALAKQAGPGTYGLYAAPQPAEQKPAPDVTALVEALEDVVSEIESNTCPHDNTYRGGAIWEICEDCGEKWADDMGGKPEFVWPESVEAARNLIAAHRKGAQP